MQALPLLQRSIWISALWAFLDWLQAVVPLWSEIPAHLSLCVLRHLLPPCLNYSYLCTWLSLSTLLQVQWEGPFLIRLEIPSAPKHESINPHWLSDWMNFWSSEWNLSWVHLSSELLNHKFTFFPLGVNYMTYALWHLLFCSIPPPKRS